MERFGGHLRRLRQARGLSLRRLAAVVHFDFGYLGQIERGDRRATVEVARKCDHALDAAGALVATYRGSVAQEDDMQRRTVLRTLTALAPGTLSLEALRQGLDRAGETDHDGWSEIVDDYAHDFYLVPLPMLVERLAADIAVLQRVAVERPADRNMSRSAAQMAVVLAVALGALGRPDMARRWWRTGRRAADRCGDLGVRLSVRAWDTVSGPYEGRPLGLVLAGAEEAVAIAGDRACAGTAGLFAGHAQALALAGRSEPAVASLRRVEEITQRLPVGVAADAESLFGWPEVRLRHTESYVYSALGHTRRAMAAQDRAMGLYPDSQVRLRAQVRLHRASCLIQDGHVGDGLGYAADTLDSLPAMHHNEMVHKVARRTLNAVPAAERRRPEARALRERLTVGAHNPSA